MFRHGRRTLLAPVILGLVTLLTLTACASSGTEEAVVEATRPDDCRLIPVGLVRIERNRLGGRSRSDQLRARGYDRFTDVQPITRTYRDSNGTLHSEVVGWEGTAWRWNDPACRMR